MSQWIDRAQEIGRRLSKAQVAFISDLLWAIAILLVAMILLRIVRAFIQRVLHHRQLKGRFLDERRANTLATILHSVARYVIYFLATITILDQFGLPVASFLTAAGIGGVALAFGAQNLVRDVITGFFLLFEDQFAMGDQVTVADVTGIVEEMTLRVTKVRDAGGQLHIIPNGKIERVTNHMGASMRALVDIPIAYEADLNKATVVLEKVFGDFRRDFRPLVDGPTLLGIESLTDYGMVLRIMARTEALKQWEAERELRRRIIGAFEQNGIELPYSRRTLANDTKGLDVK